MAARAALVVLLRGCGTHVHVRGHVCYRLPAMRHPPSLARGIQRMQTREQKQRRIGTKHSASAARTKNFQKRKTRKQSDTPTSRTCRLKDGKEGPPGGTVGREEIARYERNGM